MHTILVHPFGKQRPRFKNLLFWKRADEGKYQSAIEHGRLGFFVDIQVARKARVATYAFP